MFQQLRVKLVMEDAPWERLVVRALGAHFHRSHLNHLIGEARVHMFINLCSEAMTHSSPRILHAVHRSWLYGWRTDPRYQCVPVRMSNDCGCGDGDRCAHYIRCIAVVNEYPVLTGRYASIAAWDAQPVLTGNNMDYNMLHSLFVDATMKAVHLTRDGINDHVPGHNTKFIKLCVATRLMSAHLCSVSGHAGIMLCIRSLACKVITCVPCFT